MSFSRVETIVFQMRDLCNKLQTTNIRCSRSERLAFPKVAAQLIETASALSRNLLKQLAIKAPNESAKDFVKKFETYAHTPNAPNKSILKRNLNMIFLGPQISSLDSDQVKARKNAMRNRCNEVGSLSPGHIVMWSIHIPPSTWAAGDMSMEMFDYLVQELSKLSLPEWPSRVGDLLHTLSSEEPLSKNEKFCSFMAGTHSSDCHRKLQLINQAFSSGLSSIIVHYTDGENLASDQSTSKKRRLDKCMETGWEKHQAASTTSSSLVSNVTSVASQPRELCNSHTDTGMVKVARMASFEKLERVLGEYLHNGMTASRWRKTEVDRRIVTLTDAVRLHLAYRNGEHFKLGVRLCPFVGRAIAEANANSAEQLRSMLGDYLFEAKTGDIQVTFSHEGSGDCKLDVMLKFDAGRYLLGELYPI